MFMRELGYVRRHRKMFGNLGGLWFRRNCGTNGGVGNAVEGDR
jgi:hypothetical protein